MKLKDALIVLFAVVLVGVLGYIWFTPTGLTRAPDITVTTIHGKHIDLAKLRGRPVLITFWATTCPGCVAEMPHLIKLYKDLAPKGLEVIGVAMNYDPPNQVMAMAKERNIPYPVAVDTQGKVAKAFGDIQLTPTSFLIAPDGRIVKQKIGEMNMEAVRKQILTMTASGAASGAHVAG
ncbi:MAG TPA: TlpA disulfide reductase family protein [Gammaproteobacteria bacterium]|nr:TlpA disulfide reductase family protein [Gammaproteobacteria bacterium]